MMVSFQRKSLRLKNFDSLELLVEKFIVHNLSAPKKQRILKLRENYALVVHGPTYNN